MLALFMIDLEACRRHTMAWMIGQNAITDISFSQANKCVAIVLAVHELIKDSERF